MDMKESVAMQPLEGPYAPLPGHFGRQLPLVDLGQIGGSIRGLDIDADTHVFRTLELIQASQCLLGEIEPDDAVNV